VAIGPRAGGTEQTVEALSPHRFPRVGTETVAGYANGPHGRLGVVWAVGTVTGVYSPTACPLESETLPLQETEPSADSSPNTSAPPKWLSVTLTPVGSLPPLLPARL